MLLDQCPNVGERAEPHDAGHDQRARQGPGPIVLGSCNVDFTTADHIAQQPYCAGASFLIGAKTQKAAANRSTPNSRPWTACPHSASPIAGGAVSSGRRLVRVEGDQRPESKAALCHRDEGWRSVRHRRVVGELEGPDIRRVDTYLCANHNRRQRIGSRDSRPHAADLRTLATMTAGWATSPTRVT